MPSIVRQADFGVVGGVVRVVTPAIILRQRLAWNAGAHNPQAVGAIQHPAQRQQSGRRRLIAFLFVHANPGRPECHPMHPSGEFQSPIRMHNSFGQGNR